MRLIKVGGEVTAHSHVLFKFRCLDNRSALTLKPHQKQTYLFRARSFIAKHGVLLVRNTYLAKVGEDGVIWPLFLQNDITQN